MLDIEKWIQLYKNEVLALFKNRVIFIGLQGSYARNEANDQSDIDVVLILDRVSIEDLGAYKQAIDKLPYREIICGFVSGRDEIESWCKYDLFQFYHDTIAIYGKLSDIIETPTTKDARQAVLVGACNIYHSCSHNYLHASSMDMLKALYKSAFFVLQAKNYCDTGKYENNRKVLKDSLEETDLIVLNLSEKIRYAEEDDVFMYSEVLLTWSGGLIKAYAPNNSFK